ncbi:hypothetical protein Tco_0424566 [Tanacetum coccineum]
MLKASPLNHVKRGRDSKVTQSSGPPVKVDDEAVHKELGDRMKRAATTASSLEAKQDSDAQTWLRLHLNSPMIHLSQELTNLEVGRTDGVMGITATIDRKVKVLVYEASIRRHLKHEDFDGLSTVPTVEIFKQLALIGYVTNSNSLTFQKGHFSPQWKFLIHPILHCVSPKLNRSLQPIKDDIQDV